jgi:chemotaxis protein methyltransferase CheR
MMLKEDFPHEVATWDIRITATDLSDSMVKRCKDGLFSQLEVNRGLPAAMLMRYFHREGTEWRIDEGIRKLLDVRPANLVVPSSLPQMGGIDLVMIRNVLIYFDDATKARILTDIRSRMKKDGYLMLGSSEVTTGATAGFVRHQNGKTIYFRPGA